MIRRLRSCRVVFDGQSRVVGPGFWDGNVFLGWAWSRIVMLGRGLPAYLVGVSGQSWTSLASDFSTRAAPYISPIEPTIYVMCGGYTDYLGEGNTGAQVYADSGAMADLARTAGAAYVICTTTLPATTITGGVESARQDGNALVLADASGFFDATVDLEVSGLDDPTDTESYWDGIHIYGWPAPYEATDQGKGTVRAAAVVSPALDAAIAAVS